MKTFDLDKFCYDLISLRKKTTQEKFAKELDINRSTLSLLETGKQIPSLDIFTKVCNIGNYQSNNYFIEKENDSLIYLMGALDKMDKEKINEMIDKIKIKEKYAMLYRKSLSSTGNI